MPGALPCDEWAMGVDGVHGVHYFEDLEDVLCIHDLHGVDGVHGIHHVEDLLHEHGSHEVYCIV